MGKDSHKKQVKYVGVYVNVRAQLVYGDHKARRCSDSMNMLTFCSEDPGQAGEGKPG